MSNPSLLRSDLLKASNKLSSLGARLVNLVVPSRCVSCSSFIAAELDICSLCWSQCRRLDLSKTCQTCGYPLVGEAHTGKLVDNLCGKCLVHEVYFQKVISVFYHEDAIGRIVSRLKYSDHTYIAKFLANIIANVYIECFHDLSIDWICVPPMHLLSVRERMYNQMVLVGRHMVSILGEKRKFIPDMLIKHKYTKRQVGLEKADRERNLRGSILCNESYINKLKNSNILIIDDVMTTGTTLNECARALVQSFENVKVYGITIARTVL